MPHSSLHEPIAGWYDGHARDLPWRREGATGWEVLVSEMMLQQTPVARVLPAYRAWIKRWPEPARLAVEPPGEAVRRWGSLGYPRRALWLHGAATIIAEEYGGQVPDDYTALRALPGVGDYTANAVLAFAYRRRGAVLDTNVRRVLARLTSGAGRPAAHQTKAERRLAESLLPDEPSAAASWSVAVMELGALVCTARTPRCADCPVSSWCAWRAAGSPAPAQRSRPQRYEGTDRQCRGSILRLLRDTDGPVESRQVDAVWPTADQRARALVSLLDDGLVVRRGDGRLALP